MDKSEKQFLILSVFSFVISIGVIIFSFFMRKYNIFEFLLFLLGGVALAAFSIAWIKVILEPIRTQKKYELEEQKKRENVMNQIASGTWNVPVVQFYNECQNAGITQITPGYSIEKATLILQNILGQNNIPKEYWEIYSNEKAVRKYYALGIQILGAQNREVERASQAAEIRKRTAQIGELTKDREQYQDFCNVLAGKEGREKRIAMLSNEKNNIDQKINELLNQKTQLDNPGQPIYSTIPLEKQKDWALRGGAASGIAGAGAGVAVALKTMTENEKIKERNSALLRTSIYASQFIQENADRTRNHISNEIADFQKKQNAFCNALSDAATKIVVKNTSAKSLFSALEIKTSVQKLENGRSIQIQGTVSNHYSQSIVDVPVGTKFTIDGMLKASIYYNDQLLDTIFLPLPLYGVPCGGKPENIYAFSKSYVEAEADYKVVISPVNLWLMEA